MSTYLRMSTYLGTVRWPPDGERCSNSNKFSFRWLGPPLPLHDEKALGTISWENQPKWLTSVKGGACLARLVGKKGYSSACVLIIGPLNQGLSQPWNQRSAS